MLRTALERFARAIMAAICTTVVEWRTSKNPLHPLPAREVAPNAWAQLAAIEDAIRNFPTMAMGAKWATAFNQMKALAPSTPSAPSAAGSSGTPPPSKKAKGPASGSIRYDVAWGGFAVTSVNKPPLEGTTTHWCSEDKIAAEFARLGASGATHCARHYLSLGFLGISACKKLEGRGVHPQPRAARGLSRDQLSLGRRPRRPKARQARQSRRRCPRRTRRSQRQRQGRWRRQRAWPRSSSGRGRRRRSRHRRRRSSRRRRSTRRRRQCSTRAATAAAASFSTVGLPRSRCPADAPSIARAARVRRQSDPRRIDAAAATWAAAVSASPAAAEATTRALARA